MRGAHEGSSLGELIGGAHLGSSLGKLTRGAPLGEIDPSEQYWNVTEARFQNKTSDFTSFLLCAVRSLKACRLGDSQVLSRAFGIILCVEHKSSTATSSTCILRKIGELNHRGESSRRGESNRLVDLNRQVDLSRHRFKSTRGDLNRHFIKSPRAV